MLSKKELLKNLIGKEISMDRTDVGGEIYQLCDHSVDNGYVSKLTTGLGEKGLKFHLSPAS